MIVITQPINYAYAFSEIIAGFSDVHNDNILTYTHIL